MKRKGAVTLMILYVMALVLQSKGIAASVDTISPYDGQYMLIYNPVSSGSTLTTGALSVIENKMALNGEDVPTDASALGDTGIAVEPEFREINPDDLDGRNNMRISASLLDARYIGDTVQFTSQTVLDNEPLIYTLTARLLAEGAACSIFVEETYAGEDSPFLISAAQAGEIADEFDRVQGIMQNDFGPNLTNGDGKIVILLHNIREYKSGGSGSVYVAGFFDPGDYLYGTSDGGNDLAMLHIDIPQLLTNPSTSTYEITRGYSVMVHEFQHLINWTDTFDTYLETEIYEENELWINEMMSMAAEHMLYDPLFSRISSFNNSAKVQNGAVLTYTNYSINGSSELGANYGLPYLFGQYLRVQTEGLAGTDGAAGGNGIFRLILQSDYTDYYAVAEALGALGYSVTDFDRFHANFRIATLFNEASGNYGFCGDEAFNSVSASLYSGSGTTLPAGAAIMVALPEGAFIPATGATATFMAFSTESDGISVKKGTGEPIAALEDNQILDITANITGIDSDAVPILVAGLYTSEGRMVRLWGFVGTVGVGRTTKSLTLPSDVEGCYLKVFYMDGAVGCTPLCAMYQVG